MLSCTPYINNVTGKHGREYETWDPASKSVRFQANAPSAARIVTVRAVPSPCSQSHIYILTTLAIQL